MAALPVEVLFGVYLGLLTGIIPALVAGSLGFTVRYLTGVTLPGFGVVVVALAIAGINGGLLGLVDETIVSSPRLLVAMLVVTMLSLYAHAQGDKLGATLPRRFSLRALRRQTLSADVVDFVGGFGEVTVRPAGDVRDMEAYPPLPPELRARIREGAWRFPADLPLAELESRLVERLKTEYDLADAAVRIDARGRADIAAAPPTSGLSRRVPQGHRAVSISALLPTGMARGERVTVVTDAARVDGTVLAATSDPGKASPAPPDPPPGDGGDDAPVATDGGEDEDAEPTAPAAPTTAGGEGRITVAVPRSESTALLRADRGRVVVRAQGTRREYELLGVLRRAGNRVTRLTVRAGGPLDGKTIGTAEVRDTYGVAVLAHRRGGDGSESRGWRFSPRGDTTLAAGDTLFAVGERDALRRFEEAVA